MIFPDDIFLRRNLSSISKETFFNLNVILFLSTIEICNDHFTLTLSFYLDFLDVSIMQ